MKHTSSQFVTALLLAFGVLGITQYALGNTWQAPVGAGNVPAPLNNGISPQVKGGLTNNLDINALTCQNNPQYCDTTLSLVKIDANQPLGLRTEGFLNRGNIPTLGFMSASLAQVPGKISTSRQALQLLSGTHPSAAAGAAMTNIVLSNLGGTNTKRLGVWSEKDNNWANTRIRNGFFNKLVIGGDPFRIFNYGAGGPQQGTASYSKRFMGFITFGGLSNAHKPSTNDPDYYLNVAQAPVGAGTTCSETSNYGAWAGSYAGKHKYCYVGDNGYGPFMYEAVPVTNLDVAGPSDFGNGQTCVIKNTDECPRGSYLQKIGSFRNNLCRAFSGACQLPAGYTANATLDENVNGNIGATNVAWMEADKIPGAQYIVGLNVAQECNAANMQAVANNDNHYLTPNMELLGAMDLTDVAYEEKIIIYSKNSSMLQYPAPGVYRVLFKNSNPRQFNQTAGSDKYLMIIGEQGLFVEAVSC